MPSSNDNINEELSRALHETTSLAQTLLGEIQSNATSLATLQVKLEGLGESVKTLSAIIRDGNGKGSMITRLAILEREYEDLRSDTQQKGDQNEVFRKELHNRITKVKDMFTSEVKSESEFRREKAMTVLKFGTIAAPGAIALVLKLIEMFNK